MAIEQSQRPTHSLPRWFILYQDHAGLSVLVVALMGINGVVYGSGVINDITRPGTWGVFGTILFVLFFMAGTVMPGLALRFGVGMFTGSWFRRALCAWFTLVYFGVEVWASITERSLSTVTTPADIWLMRLLGQPSLPFSPTVLAISLSLSLAVVGWGIVVTPPQVEDVATAEQKEQLRTMQARYRAERMSITAAGAAGSIRSARLALTGQPDAPVPALPAPKPQKPDERDERDDPPATGTTGARKRVVVPTPIHSPNLGRQRNSMITTVSALLPIRATVPQMGRLASA